MADQGVFPTRELRLDQPRRPVFGGVPQEGEAVDGRVIVAGHDGVEHRCMSQFILANTGQSEVLLQERRHSDPFRVALAHQVLVVGESQ